MEEKRSGNARGAIGLIAGTILGAGVALLYAPQSGEKTRRDILYYSKKGRRKARRVAREFSDTVSGMVDTLEENAMSVVEKGKETAQEAKEGVLEAIEEGRERISHRRERLERKSG